jgi:hypothetical protein
MTNNNNINNIDIKDLNLNKYDLVGLGDQIVYAGGWKTENFECYLYQSDELKSDKLLIKLIDQMFNHKLYGYTFFVHNLGRFDSLYLINGLSCEDSNYEIKGK